LNIKSRNIIIPKRGKNLKYENTRQNL